MEDLIKRKLEGNKLTEEETMLLHIFLIENDEDYRKCVDNELKKDLKKYVPKGTIIK